MNPVKKLQHELNKNKGVRIGQTAVVSRKVHTINPITPQKINIVVNSDAGQVFYQRLLPNEIIHIDLFHEIKTFNLKQLANFVKKALEISSFSHLMNNIDIQTGSGGGRLTGDLCYGMTESLKKSHLNHVHIAAFIPEEELESIFLIVDNFEQALLEQGVELRKIEKILHEIRNSPMDLSSHTSHSDSNLKQNSDVLRKDRFKEMVEMIEHFGGLNQIEDVLEAVQKKENFKISPQSLKKKMLRF
jgi:magnesium chelatase subunit D